MQRIVECETGRSEKNRKNHQRYWSVIELTDERY